MAEKKAPSKTSKKSTKKEPTEEKPKKASGKTATTNPKKSSSTKQVETNPKQKASETAEATPDKKPTPAQPQVLENQEVKVTVEKKPNCMIHLTVSASSVILQKAYDKAFKSVRKEIELPGFRKGKAPKDLVQKKYQDAIQNRVKNEAANLAFASAFALVKIPLLNQNSKVSYSPLSFESTSAVLHFSYETHPEIPVIDPKKYPLGNEGPQKIGKKEREEAMKQMRLFYAKWTPVSDRGVQEKDFVILDVKTLDEPVQPVFSDTRFEVSDTHMAEWMKQLVLGKKTGEQIEGYSEPDKKASQEEKEAFTKKRVLITIKKIETAQLPPLDEEFAKKAGAASIEKLEQYLETMLHKKAEEKFLQEEREKVNRFLLEEYPFDMPLSLLEAEKTHRKNQMLQDASRAKELAAMSQAEQKALEEELLRQSEEAVRLFYLSRDIVRKNNISVAENEVKEEARRTLQTFGPVHVDMNNIPEEVFALALSKVILSKAQKFVLKGAQDPEEKEPAKT